MCLSFADEALQQIGDLRCAHNYLSRAITKFSSDYLMLNTDRGADNFMIKYCEGDHEKLLVDVAPSRSVRLEMPVMSELRSSSISRSNSYQPTLSPVPSGSNTPDSPDYKRKPHIHIAAIDNSLSFPHEHPQGWRSYTYGWHKAVYWVRHILCYCLAFAALFLSS